MRVEALDGRLNFRRSIFYSKGDLKIQKSCKYCGKVHDENHICSKKPIKKKKIDDATQFRNSPKWQRKRKQIKERDNYLCQICIREIYGAKRKYNHENLQVHHAIPINTNEDLKLDESNLITLCSMHHSMCDKGKIPYQEVKNIIVEQTQKEAIPPLPSVFSGKKVKHRRPS